MTLLKMTGMNDDLPLRFGARLPRDYERKANIAKMEAAAKALDDMDVRNGPVKWVGDAAQVRPSDCKHPVMQESMRAFERSREPLRKLAEQRGHMPPGFYDVRIGVDLAEPGGDDCVAVRSWVDSAEGRLMVAPITRAQMFKEPEQTGPYTKVGENQYTWLDVNSDEEWTLTPPTDAEVRDFYKDRALGRGISTHESTLWAHRMDLRQHLRTDGAFVPDPGWRAKVEAAGLQMLMAAHKRLRHDSALQRACDAIGSDLTTAWLRGGE